MAVKAGQQFLVPSEEPNEPTKEEPLSLVLFESPFASDSTVSKCHLSLVSLFLPSILHAENFVLSYPFLGHHREHYLIKVIELWILEYPEQAFFLTSR